MIAATIENRIKATEEMTGESAEYLRDIYRGSPAALFKFALFLPLAGHRKAASVEQIYAAKLATAIAEDCGPCRNIIIRFALKDRVDRQLIRSILSGAVDHLPDDVAEVFHFAKAVTDDDPSTPEFAAALARRHGQAALVDIAMAIASTRVFPTIKKALGHGRSCSMVPADL